MSMEMEQLEREIIGRYSDMLHKAQRALHDEMDAEDVVHDVFISLITAPHILATVEKFGGWLSTLIYRRSIDLIRKKTRQRNHESADEVGGLHSETNAADELEELKLLEILTEVIDELPPQLRFPVLENAVEGKPFRQISAESGIPMGTLMARKKTAIAEIRRRLGAKGITL